MEFDVEPRCQIHLHLREFALCTSVIRKACAVVRVWPAGRDSTPRHPLASGDVRLRVPKCAAEIGIKLFQPPPRWGLCCGRDTGKWNSRRSKTGFSYYFWDTTSSKTAVFKWSSRNNRQCLLFLDHEFAPRNNRQCLLFLDHKLIPRYSSRNNKQCLLFLDHEFVPRKNR